MDEVASQAADVINENKSFDVITVIKVPGEKEAGWSDTHNRLLDNSMQLNIGSSTETSSSHILNYSFSPANSTRYHERNSSFFLTTSRPSLLDSVIKIKMRQFIGFNRESEKLKKTWMNRGLPVDKETINSAANKDAFNLRSLKESLPSTSSEIKPTFTRSRIVIRARPSMTESRRSWMDVWKFERKLTNDVWSLSDKQNEEKKPSEAVPQSSSFPCQGQETAKNFDRSIPNSSGTSSRVDGQEQRGNAFSDVAALARRCQDVCSRWDFRNHCARDFQPQNSSYPAAESSEKKEEGENGIEIDVLAESLKRSAGEVRKIKAEVEQRMSKLGALQGYRLMDLLPGDKHELENEIFASGETTTVGESISMCDDVQSLPLQKMMQRKRLMSLRESVKNFRSLRSFSVVGLKSDKVVAD